MTTIGSLRPLLVLCALALGLWLPAGAAQGEALQDARRAVDARRFDLALPLYESLLRSRPDDADLLIETARVYGFADRHREAEATYRRVLQAAPARRKDVLGALAWQTLWSGDARAALPLFAEARGYTTDARLLADLWRGEGEARVEIGDNTGALDAYERALTLTPDDKTLRRRIATVWLWLDDLERSEQVWRALLAEDPADRRSQAGLARTLNAAGRHNEAAVLYRSLDDGSDAGVRLEHARALRWAGYDAAAYPLLLDRTDADAAWLRDWRVVRETQPYLYGSVEFALDADDLDTGVYTVGGGTWLSPTWLLDGGYRRVSLDAPEGAVAGQRLFATLRGAFGRPGETPPGLLIPAVSIGLNDYDGWSPVTGNASLRWLPVDLWRLTADLGREVVETPLAVANRITADVGTLGVEYRLPPRWEFAAALSSLRFSDGNDRSRLVGRVGHALRLQPRVVVGVEGMALEDSRPASFADPRPPGTLPPAGYWSPKDYAEGRAFAGIYAERQPWEWFVRVALGVSRETDGDGNSSTGHPNLLEAGVAHDLGPGLRWRAYAGGSGSSFGGVGGDTGYWRRYVGFTLVAWF